MLRNIRMRFFLLKSIIISRIIAKIYLKLLNYIDFLKRAFAAIAIMSYSSLLETICFLFFHY